MTKSISAIKQWINSVKHLQSTSKIQSTTDDIICPKRYQLLANLLHQQPSGPSPPNGHPSALPSENIRQFRLPPSWHLIYCQHSYSMAGNKHLSPDGYYLKDGPPLELGFNYRVWAGSHLKWSPDNPLVVGQQIRESSRIIDAQLKFSQRDGQPMVFVTLEKLIENLHDCRKNNGLVWKEAVKERRTLAYRQHSQRQSGVDSVVQNTMSKQRLTSSVSENENKSTAVWTPDTVTLFQYSALTFNSHRVHFDYPYCTREEGFPDLLVHGPLTSTMLLEHLRQCLVDFNIVDWQYKALAPLYCNQPVYLTSKPLCTGRYTSANESTRQYRLQARNSDGLLCMQGTATVQKIS